MLDFRGISVHYGHQDVLSDVTFRVNKGDRVGRILLSVGLFGSVF